MRRVRYLSSIYLNSILPFIFFAGCVSHLTEENSSCPCSPGWKCCDGTCIAEDKTCDKDGGNDDGTTEDGGDDPGADGEVDGGADPGDGVQHKPVCSCKNQQDSWSIEMEKRCIRDDYSCNALNPCEDGYHCFGQCVCVDIDLCGIACSDECICPGLLVCDENTGICRQSLACLEDSMCPEGTVCREPMPSPNHIDN